MIPSPEWFQPPRKVLFVTHPFIGDALNLTPAQRWMKEAWPGCKLVTLATRVTAPIFESSGLSDEIWTRPESMAERLQTVVKIRKEQFDLAVFSYAQRTLLRFVRSVGVPRVVGVRKRPSEKWDFAVSERQGKIKVPGELADLLSALGCDCSDATPIVQPSRADCDRVDSLLSVQAAPFVAVHTGASEPAKKWPLERFGVIAEAVRDAGFTPVFIGGKEETKLAESIEPRGSLNLVGQTSILETVALLSRCKLLVSSDSGPVHLAAAAGIRSVVLFGPTLATNHAPYGEGHVCLQGECPWDCDVLELCDGSCMRSLATDVVWEAMKSVLTAENVSLPRV